MLGKDGHGGAENNYQNSLVVKNVGLEGSIEKCEQKSTLEADGRDAQLSPVRMVQHRWQLLWHWGQAGGHGRATNPGDGQME